LSGRDRYHLYLTAAGTGFRASALANLTPDDFDLNDTAPVVTLPARFNKSRKLKIQPLPADVAAALRDYLQDKPTGAPIWGGTWAKDHGGAEMLRNDLEAAGIPYAVEGPDGPEYADFHSLRHSYLTLGGRSGIDLRTLQELAGHSKPELTARYSHRRLYDLQGAVGKFPGLVPTSAPNAEEIPLRMTGTDAATTGQNRDFPSRVSQEVGACWVQASTFPMPPRASPVSKISPNLESGSGHATSRPAPVPGVTAPPDDTASAHARSTTSAIRAPADRSTWSLPSPGIAAGPVGATSPPT
jgi:hypothetical protein